MKPNFIDRVVGFFSPQAGTLRLENRMKQDLLLRGYDAAKDFRTSDWQSASKTSANAEIKVDQKKVRERARDLSRNNPYGVRALSVITANTVGSGIGANITGKNDAQTEKLNELWRSWAETTMIDVNGRRNFYGQQALIMRTTVESGEGLARKVQTKLGPKYLILESDFINSAVETTDGLTIQGIQFDKNGNRVKYHMFSSHPGDKGTTAQLLQVPAEEIHHVYREDRPGQVRGMPWSHAVIEALKDFDDYQRATLIGRKIAACFAAFITTNESGSLLSAEDRKAKREADMTLEPATVRYLNQGESVQFGTPPAVSGYGEFVRESLRAVAAGFGLSYEAMTGDYSQSNYSSSRMGHLEFRRNIEDWRWNMLIPQYCEPVFATFREFAGVMLSIAPEDIKVEWVPPAYEMIDPTKDISAIRNAIRSGLMTLPQAIRAQGYDPSTQLKEISETNKKLDELEISLDTDPRKMSTIGFAQAGDSLDKLANVKALPGTEQEEGTTSE